MAQLVNVIAPIFSNETGLFLQTIYYPLQLIANNSKGKALSLFTGAPAYESKRFGSVPYLDTSAALDGSTLVLNVGNGLRTKPSRPRSNYRTRGSLGRWKSLK